MDSTSVVLSARNHSKTSDRISNLPQDLIERILECLPLQEAARTSILSSQWKHKWASISQIVLDKQFCTSFKKGRLVTVDISSAYSKAVNDILFSHVGPICKFVLYLPSWFPEEEAEADITRWIRYAHANGVKEFMLENDVLGRKGKLPSCMFNCVGLTHLALKSCKLLSLPPTFGGFPYLRSLKLWTSVSGFPCIKTDVLGMLISKCPQLESLYLVMYETTDLTICAPKLKDLFVKGMLWKLCLEGTSVNTLALDIRFINFSYSSYCITDFFICVAKVEKLVLGRKFWRMVKSYKLSVEIPIKLERLQTLKLVDLPLHCQYSISFVLCLLSSSPLVKQLCIKAAKEKEIPENDLSAQFDGSFNLQCLLNMQLLHLSGSKCELQLVKFLLANSVVLEKMTIKLAADIGGAKDKFNFAWETSRFCKASPNAEVIINT